MTQSRYISIVARLNAFMHKLKEYTSWKLHHTIPSIIHDTFFWVLSLVTLVFLLQNQWTDKWLEGERRFSCVSNQRKFVQCRFGRWPRKANATEGLVSCEVFWSRMASEQLHACMSLRMRLCICVTIMNIIILFLFFFFHNNEDDIYSSFQVSQGTSAAIGKRS